MLTVYNTLTRQKEPFVPLREGKVRMYVCGMTVYDYCHLGHARALITFDVIYRYFLHKGWQVIYVRNFTDIDDKIIKRSQESKTSWRELTQNFIQAFSEDAQALGLKKPTHEPKATDHIHAITSIIKKLKEHGLAYSSGGDVFFSVRKFKGYGQLSGRHIDELAAGARVDVLESKRDPLDFTLWKGAKPGEPSWPSPWGEGRPGWHIECSAMSMEYLSESFDIHGGGRDLVFPHHENEIAQSEGATGKKFARFWLHNGFVNINTEKMSKSLGNFLLIRAILKQYPAEVVRLFMLSSHYRSPLDYTEQNIYDSAAGLERYYQTVQRLKLLISKNPPSAGCEDLSARLERLYANFESAMDDDFNTARVVGQVFEWVRMLNKSLDEEKLSGADAKKFLEITGVIHEVCGVFGSDPQEYLSEFRNKGIQRAQVSEDEIKNLIAERQQARAARDFKKADKIRDELAGKGIILKDHPDGSTTWTVER